jgi:hypothetical protein
MTLLTMVRVKGAWMDPLTIVKVKGTQSVNVY